MAFLLYVIILKMCLCWISASGADTIGEQELEELTDSFSYNSMQNVYFGLVKYFAFNFVVVTLRNA